MIIWSASVTLGCATGILTVAATGDVMNIIAIIQIYVCVEFPHIPFTLSHETNETHGFFGDKVLKKAVWLNG